MPGERSPGALYTQVWQHYLHPPSGQSRPKASHLACKEGAASRYWRRDAGAISMGYEWRHSPRLSKELGASHMDISDGVALVYTFCLCRGDSERTPLQRRTRNRRNNEIYHQRAAEPPAVHLWIAQWILTLRKAPASPEVRASFNVLSLSLKCS